MATKSRTTGGGTYTGYSKAWGGTVSMPGDGQTFPYGKGAQIVVSEGNPYQLLGRGFNVGGPFISQKVEIEGSIEPMWVGSEGRFLSYTALYPSDGARSASHLAGSNPSTDAIAAHLNSYGPSLVPGYALDARGATAISRCNPTNPVFDASTTIAEAISERKLFAVPGRNGGVSGEYLNVQLGVLPVHGAYQDLREAMANSEKLLAQLHRDSGRPVRRRYEFPSTPATFSEESFTGRHPWSDCLGHAGYQLGYGTLTTRTWTEEKSWFSGAFTYHVPKELGMRRTLAEMDRLYGVKPGVDTAWELIPFSFVADYFANMGDVVKNLNAIALDGLVLVYGYVMAKQVKRITEVWEGPIEQSDGSYRTVEVTCNRVYTTMQRLPANPFGFGITEEMLTPRQLSILAALGMSRR